MNKIPTLLVRNPDDRAHVLDEVTPGCEWVLAGEGVATRKFDGTCVMKDAANWWARREVKPGRDIPAGFAVVNYDEITGKTIGWEPIEQSSFYRWFLEAVVTDPLERDGTYELIGPKINGNPEHLSAHELVRHGARVIELSAATRSGVPDVADIKEAIMYLAEEFGYEGIVWHHPDGRMAKLKARDLT